MEKEDKHIMRFGSIILLAALISCAPQSDNDDHITNQSAPTGKAQMSESARAAQKVVERYFQFIREGKFLDAYKLWGNGGADTRGTAAAFAESFARYKSYTPEVGEPTEIKTSDGRDYISVLVKLHVVTKVDGKTLDQSGVVMLRRPANAQEPLADTRDWRIWGTDIRARH